MKDSERIILKLQEAEGRLISEHTLQEDIVDIARYDLAKLKPELYHCSPNERNTIFSARLYDWY